LISSNEKGGVRPIRICDRDAFHREVTAAAFRSLHCLRGAYLLNELSMLAQRGNGRPLWLLTEA